MMPARLWDGVSFEEWAARVTSGEIMVSAPWSVGRGLVRPDTDMFVIALIHPPVDLRENGRSLTLGPFRVEFRVCYDRLYLSVFAEPPYAPPGLSVHPHVARWGGVCAGDWWNKEWGPSAHKGRWTLLLAQVSAFLQQYTESAFMRPGDVLGMQYCTYCLRFAEWGGRCGAHHDLVTCPHCLRSFPPRLPSTLVCDTCVDERE